MEIKKLLNQDYAIICDTNVFLHIYRYSPEFSDFALKCIQAVREHIVLPSTVNYEFKKHHRAYHGDMKKRVEKIGKEAERQIENSKRKVLNICDNLEALQYPDISELSENLEEKFSELTEIAQLFFEERGILGFISDPWNGNDLVKEQVDFIISTENLLPNVTQDVIYQICEDGEKRYKHTPPLPPGFKDAKDKDGVRKYSDLIIWKEIIKYAREENKNVFWITDDAKSDWWEKNGEKDVFHPFLTREFENETGKKICALNALDFYNIVSTEYEIPKADAVEIALRITDDAYIEQIHEAVFESIADSLSISGERYLDTYTNSGVIGIEELEIDTFSFLKAEQTHRNNDMITYIFEYYVEVDATSFDYWGKDNETKEILVGPHATHSFEGNISVEVTRQADMYLDFESDKGFESTLIVEGHLNENNFQHIFEEMTEEVEDAYNTCPDCGKKINYLNDGGNGFCIACAHNH